jgi:predicted Zn-ribbon and HTH transcriptional regulator
MIRIVLGQIGSGKTAHIVREIVKNQSDRITYSNINIFDCPNAIKIKPEMIIKVNDDAKTKKEKYKVNVEYWQKQVSEGAKINVVLDEAHTLLNARRGASTINVVMTDFLSMLRRVIGANSQIYGELILITQLERRLDVISREMAQNITYCLCKYVLRCNDCGLTIQEHNEVAKKMKYCFRCKSPSISKFNHVVEIWEFTSLDNFEKWKEAGLKTYYEHYNITDIEDYFKHYNTFQWEDMLSGYD